MVLTNQGRLLLSKGELEFTYFVLFDDEVDYSPAIVESGSLTAAQLSSSIDSQIEATLVMEAIPGYRLGVNMSGSDFTSVHRPVFTMPQGQKLLPRVTTDNFQSGTLDIGSKHRKIQDIHVKTDSDGNVKQTFGPYDRGYERYDAKSVKVDLTYRDFAVDPSRIEGFLIRVYKSGSDGLVELSDKRDSESDVAYSSDIKLIDTLLGGGVTNGS